jgi:two-component system response regulator DesR
VIRTLLAHRGNLFRGALAHVLGAEDDIEVVAEIGKFGEMVDAMLVHHPKVTVLDLDLLPLEELPGLRGLRRTVPGCAVLVLAEARRSGSLGPAMAGPVPGLGFLAKDCQPGRLVTAVRSVAGGEPVLDPELVMAALRTGSPLTRRETEVLRIAAEGVPLREVAHRLTLSPGTVRNHLSRVIGKVGARTRIEAVRIAQDSGWI